MKLVDILNEDKVRGKPQKLSTTRTFELMSDFAKNSKIVEKIVEIHSTGKGMVALLRTKDGDAYEVEITPSYMGDYFQDKRGVA